MTAIAAPLGAILLGIIAFGAIFIGGMVPDINRDDFARRTSRNTPGGSSRSDP